MSWFGRSVGDLQASSGVVREFDGAKWKLKTSFTTTERDLIVGASQGMLIYNATTGQNEVLFGPHWIEAASSQNYVQTLTITAVVLSFAVGVSAAGQAVSATGGSGTKTFTVSSGSLPVGVNLSSDGTLSGTPTQAGPYSFAVTASDAGVPIQTSTRVFSGSVAAGLTMSANALYFVHGYPATAQFISATGGTGAKTYSVTSGSLPAGVTLNSDGTFSGTPTTVAAYSFTVTATDAGPPILTTTRTCSGTVEAALDVTSTIGNISKDIAFSTSLGVNKAGTYTWALVSGALPAGMSLSTAGLFSGTPTALGAYDFTVRATRSETGEVSTQQYTGNVVSSTPISISPASGTALTAASQFGVYQSQLFTLSGGSGAYLVTASSTPAGISIDTSTLAASDTFKFTAAIGDLTSVLTNATVSVLAENTVAPFDSTLFTFNLSVAATPISVTPNGIYDAWEKGIAIQAVTVAASGGTAPYTYSAAGLPDGVTIDSSTGVISGTPTVDGFFDVRIYATDSTNKTGRLADRIEVTPAMHFATFALTAPSTTVTLSNYRQSTRPVNGSVSGNQLTITDAGDYRIVCKMPSQAFGSAGSPAYLSISGGSFYQEFNGEAMTMDVDMYLANVPAGQLLAFNLSANTTLSRQCKVTLEKLA